MSAMIWTLSRSSLHHHDHLCSGICWCELMFYLECSSPNEQQAEVMNATPIAEPSDYCPKTYLRALTYQVVCSGAYVPPFLIQYCASEPHRQRKRAASVMRSGESKSERPEHCAQKGPNEAVKKDGEGKMKCCCRCPQTAWRLLTPSF